MRKQDTSLKTQMQEFNAKLLAKGKKLTTYVCPHCGETIQTLQPEVDQVTSKGYWDSLKRCYECDEPSFVTVYPSGETEVAKLDIPTAQFIN